jgi:lysophospholipase L1-like esterase
VATAQGAENRSSRKVNQIVAIGLTSPAWPGNPSANGRLFVSRLRGKPERMVRMRCKFILAAVAFALLAIVSLRAGFGSSPDRGNTVMLGDSITASGFWNDLFPGKAIANRGISGDTIEGIRNRIGGIIQMKPEKVFIMAGINNLLRGSSAEQVFPMYADVVRELRSAGSQVFVESTLLTAANFRPAVNTEVRKPNDKLQKFCSIERACKFIDLNTRLAPDGQLEFSSDGLHLSSAGYEHWRDEIAPNMRE